MTINLIPYGQLPDGNYGINLDNLTGDPIASVMEVKDTLPAAGDPLNFVGRLVFAKDVQKAFIFNDTPSPFWDPLEGIPAEVDAVAGNPPTVPTPPLGGLFWDSRWVSCFWQKGVLRCSPTKDDVSAQDLRDVPLAHAYKSLLSRHLRALKAFGWTVNLRRWPEDALQRRGAAYAA